MRLRWDMGWAQWERRWPLALEEHKRSSSVPTETVSCVGATPFFGLSWIRRVSTAWKCLGCQGGTSVRLPVLRNPVDDLPTAPTIVLGSRAATIELSKGHDVPLSLGDVLARCMRYSDRAALGDMLWMRGGSNRRRSAIASDVPDHQHHCWRLIDGDHVVTRTYDGCPRILPRVPSHVRVDWHIVQRTTRRVTPRSFPARAFPGDESPAIHQGDPNHRRQFRPQRCHGVGMSPHMRQRCSPNALVPNRIVQRGMRVLPHRWSTSKDHAIRHVLGPVLDALDRLSEPSSMCETVSDTILAGVGHSDPSTLVALLIRLLPVLPGNWRPTLVRCRAERQRPGTTILRPIVRALVDRVPAAPTIRVLDALANGWHATTAPVLVTTAHAPGNRFTQHTPADVTEQDARMPTVVGTMVRRGWRHGELRRMTAPGERVVTWMTAAAPPHRSIRLHRVRSVRGHWRWLPEATPAPHTTAHACFPPPGRDGKPRAVAWDQG
jgi:hypothetical protein